MPEFVALIGFGSNLGKRAELINRALKALGALPQTYLSKLSSLYETAPVGYLEQGAFFNGVVEIKTSLSAPSLLVELHAIENSLGRERIERWGPRTLDLDILFFEDQIVSATDLLIPHPELIRRLFVLEPLCEIVPDFVHPELCESITNLLKKYQLSHPAEEPCQLICTPADVGFGKEKENDGIFYRYSES